jgi:hypothetical protein
MAVRSVPIPSEREASRFPRRDPLSERRCIKREPWKLTRFITGIHSVATFGSPSARASRPIRDIRRVRAVPCHCPVAPLIRSIKRNIGRLSRGDDKSAAWNISHTGTDTGARIRGRATLVARRRASRGGGSAGGGEGGGGWTSRRGHAPRRPRRAF